MTAHVHAITPPGHPRRRHLAVVDTPRRRPPLSGVVCLFAAGMTPGFLLATAAASQGGATEIHATLVAAGAAFVVALGAGARARQIERRRRRRRRERAERRPAAVAPRDLRRAA